MEALKNPHSSGIPHLIPRMSKGPAIIDNGDGPLAQTKKLDIEQLRRGSEPPEDP